MMNTCHNRSVSINGWTVYGEAGSRFRAINENTIIRFEAEGRNGGLYFNVRNVLRANRCYTAQRFTVKYTATVRDLAFHLADNNYLWDYIAQRPFLEVREEKKRRVDAQRIAAGKAPLYQ